MSRKFCCPTTDEIYRRLREKTDDPDTIEAFMSFFDQHDYRSFFKGDEKAEADLINYLKGAIESFEGEIRLLCVDSFIYDFEEDMKPSLRFSGDRILFDRAMKFLQETKRGIGMYLLKSRLKAAKAASETEGEASLINVDFAEHISPSAIASLMRSIPKDSALQSTLEAVIPEQFNLEDVISMSDLNSFPSSQPEPKEANKEFTVGRRILAIKYLLEAGGMHVYNDSAAARFMNFISGNSFERARKKWKKPEADTPSKRKEDLRYLRKLFSAMELEKVLELIDKDLNDQ